MRRKYIDDLPNPKQYGFKSKRIKIYRQDEKCYFNFVSEMDFTKEMRITDGTLNTLVESIMYMTPDEAEIYFIKLFDEGKIKKL